MCLNVFKKCANIYFCLEQRMIIHRIEKGSFGKSNRNCIQLFLFFFKSFHFSFFTTSFDRSLQFYWDSKNFKKIHTHTEKNGESARVTIFNVVLLV
jgi:hypothetical protein